MKVQVRDLVLFQINFVEAVVLGVFRELRMVDDTVGIHIAVDDGIAVGDHDEALQ